ncbi:MAG TPA: hypothetical protein VLA16_10860 [Ideonella sp.]|nr:hypothetical protein [Ideonella sp.]
MRALQKAGLVELGDEPNALPPEAVSGADDAAAVIGELRAARQAQQPPTPSPAVPAVAATSPPEPGAASAQPAISRQPQEIYAEAQVPASPFPAEKLIKVLDGLAALDPVSRKAAVMALDAADDAWSIDDILLDAQRKIAALADAKAQLQALSDSVQAQAREQVSANEQTLADATARIRGQITDLEALMAREVARCTQERADIEHQARNTQDACTAEGRQLDAEAARLGEIDRIFGRRPDAA